MADAPNVPTHKPGEDGRGKFRWAAVYEAITGATAPGNHHESAPGVHTDSLVAGHEPDKYSAKGIIMVPVLVILAAGFTYGLVTAVFAVFTPGAPNADGANPVAAADGSRPYNQRVTDIDSSNPNAEVPQPRLEYMRQIENERKRSDGTVVVEPEYLRSFKPKPSAVNSPEIYPQDLYPDRYVDHTTGKRVLAEHDWVSKEKGVARIPVADAMKLTVGKLAVRKDGQAKPASGTLDAPKISNGGQTPPAPVPAAAPAPKPDEKKPEAPKAPEKKDEKAPAAPEKKG